MRTRANRTPNLHRLCAWFTALLALFHLYPASLAKAAPPDREEYLLTLVYRGKRIGELVPAYVPVTGQGESDESRTVLIHAADLFRALGVTVSDNADGSISGAIEPSGVKFHIWPNGRYALDGKAATFDSSDYTNDTEGIYLTGDAVAHFVPVRLELELGRQALLIEAVGALPFDVNRAREIARAKLVEHKILQTAAPLNFPYQLAEVAAADLRIDAYRHDEGQFRLGYDGLLAGELAHMTALVFFTGTQQDVLNDVRLKLGRENGSGGVFGLPTLTSIFAGDVTVPQLALVGGGSGRGILIDAFPLERPDAFDRTTLEGDAPIGWEAELYRNNELLAYAKVGSDGRFRFVDVPLQYSENHFRIKLYGPNGEVRELHRSQNVGAGLAPAGKFRWRAFVAENNARIFEAILPSYASRKSGGLIYSLSSDLGLAQWLTLNASTSRLAENHSPHSALVRSYGAGIRLALPIAYLEFDSAWQAENSRSHSGGYAWSMSALGEIKGVNFAVRHARFNDFLSQKALRGASPLDSYSEFRASTSLTWAELPITLTATGQKWFLSGGGNETLFQAVARFSIGNFFITQGLERRTIASSRQAISEKWTNVLTSISANLTDRFRLALASRLRPGSVSLEQFQIVGTQRLDDRTTVNLGLSRFRSQVQIPGWEFSVGGSRRFGQIWISASLSKSAANGMTFGLGASLSLGKSRAGLRFVQSDSANKGRAELQIFHDINDDGRFDGDGDEPLTGARIILDGNRSVGDPADQQGMLYLEGLPTSRPVTIDIDPKSIGDPFLRSAIGPITIQPRRGGTFTAGLPLVDTGSISGAVKFSVAGTAATVGGIKVDLLRIRDSGSADKSVLPIDPEIVATSLTQPDGSFLFDLLIPGRYKVRLHDEQIIEGRRIVVHEADVELSGDSLEQYGVNLMALSVDDGKK